MRAQSNSPSAVKMRAWRAKNPEKAKAAHRHYYTKNKVRILARSSSYEKRNRPTVLARKKHWAKRTGWDYRRWALKKLFNLSDAQVDYLLNIKQCQICGIALSAKGRHCVDHDHSTNQVRGVLCKRCNRGLGMLGDNKEGVRAALGYLESAPAGLF